MRGRILCSEVYAEDASEWDKNIAVSITVPVHGIVAIYRRIAEEDAKHCYGYITEFDRQDGAQAISSG